jgi:hypothetical protein
LRGLFAFTRHLANMTPLNENGLSKCLYKA